MSWQAIVAAAAVVCAAAGCSSDTMPADDTSRVDNTVSVDEAAQMLIDWCLGEVSDPASEWGTNTADLSPMEECITLGSLYGTFALQDIGATVVDDHGERLDMLAIREYTERRALEMWRDQG